MIWVGKTWEEKRKYAFHYSQWLLEGIAYHCGIFSKIPKIIDASGKIIRDPETKLIEMDGFEVAIKGNEKLEEMYELYKKVEAWWEETSHFDNTEEGEKSLEEVEKIIEEMEKIFDKFVDEYQKGLKYGRRNNNL
ncbi:MAG: hypothetical protein QXU74_04220 [Candidatus Aenigmatarchaeota archaeon]